MTNKSFLKFENTVKVENALKDKRGYVSLHCRTKQKTQVLVEFHLQIKLFE